MHRSGRVFASLFSEEEGHGTVLRSETDRQAVHNKEQQAKHSAERKGNHESAQQPLFDETALLFRVQVLPGVRHGLLCRRRAVLPFKEIPAHE